MRTLSIVTALMLLLAIPSGGWLYDYSIILRWGIALSCLIHAYLFIQKGNHAWMWIFLVIAVVYNPFVLVPLPKEGWVMIDFITAVLFLTSAVRPFTLRFRETDRESKKKE
jgi:hypothetical protein